jgi:hypothetical protein
VSITRGGGVAGLLRVTEVEADDVPAGALAALRAAGPSGSPPRPDEMTYAVRVGDDEARFTDSTLPVAVRELIAWADAHPARRERIAPPG